ncbi:MAG: TetR/AcrR family transcriptional regulator [Actinobacteria bacterium]|nr:TetR/AcrR family transcriptional regulator [Actinomycetota bacterium]
MGTDAPEADDAEAIVRRAPYASNPNVGARGQRTQERILDAAADAFSEAGYHECSIEQITARSGCSRVSFYQYFSGKDDLFRHLAGRVARELAAAVEAVAPFTGDQAGWDALHDWLDRYAKIYERYEPVFLAFQSAVRIDDAVADGAARVATHTSASIRALIQGSPRPPREVDGIVRALLSTVSPANRMVTLLEKASTGGRGWRRSDVNVALADIFHRALFQPDAAINVHRAPRRARPRLAGTTGGEPAGGAGRKPLGPVASKRRDAILDASVKVFADRGYHAARVADIVAGANVSHGLFYRYFESKADIFQILAKQAVERLHGAFRDIPIEAGSDHQPLRIWLRTYAKSYTAEASIIGMWIEAMSRGDEMARASVAAIESGRSALARGLDARGFGDAETEAVVLLVLLFAMVQGRFSTKRLELFATLIELGLLTPPRPGVSVGRAAGPRPARRRCSG